MQALVSEESFTLNCIYPKKLSILYCCLLIIASIITMFSFQGTSASFTRICIFRRFAPKNTYFYNLIRLSPDSTVDHKDYKARFARLVIAQ